MRTRKLIVQNINIPTQNAIIKKLIKEYKRRKYSEEFLAEISFEERERFWTNLYCQIFGIECELLGTVIEYELKRLTEMGTESYLKYCVALKKINKNKQKIYRIKNLKIA